MVRELTQRELRNDSGKIMRELDSGASYVITRNGVSVGTLSPAPHRQFVGSDQVLATFKNAPPVDARRFRGDVDRALNLSSDPRA